MKCDHPHLIPTQWNQTKPEPCDMVGCCEHNQSCPICGFGFGTSPCPCTKKTNDEILKETFKNKDIWGRKVSTDNVSHQYFFGENVSRVVKSLRK